jgi:hypothetical protein
MANTSFALLKAYNWPSNVSPDADIRYLKVTGLSGTCYPGQCGYFSAANTICLSNGPTNYAGVIGLKFDQEIDSAYDDNETGVPFVMHKPGVQVPIFIADNGAAALAGTTYDPSATAGTAAASETSGYFKLSKDIADNDLRAFAIMI